MRKLLAAALLASSAGTIAAQSGTNASPAPCVGPEWKQFDFWIGEWDVSWPAGPNSPAGSGTNRIEKALDGCVVSENFAAAGGPSPLIGRSVSVYSPRLKKWQQTWVDNKGSYLDFTGEFADGKMILSREAVGRDGKPRTMRMVFLNIRPDSLDWSWEASTDGGKTWTVQWPIHYTRKKKP